MARRSYPPFEFSRSGPSPAWVAWTIFFIGVLLTALVHWRVVRADERRLAEDFSHSVDAQVQGLREVARNYESRFEGIRTLLEFSTDVTRDDFNGAGIKLLAALPSLDAVEWAPLVQRSERRALEQRMHNAGLINFQIRNRTNPEEMVQTNVAPEAVEYIPVIYRAPIPTRSDALGFNMLTALRKSAALAARETGQTILSERGQLFDNKEGVLGFLLFVPVYQILEPSAGSVTQKRGDFRGLIIGIVRLDRFLPVIFGRQPGVTGHELMIEDASASAQPNLVGGVDAGGSVVLDQQVDRKRFEEPEVIHRTIPLWGRTLKISFRRVAASPSPLPLARIDVIAGLLVSGAFALLGLNVTRRRSHIEQQVALRTHELKRIQLELEKDIAQRREVETRLRISEQRYRSLFDQNPEAVASFDLEGRFVSANTGVERLTGYSLAEINAMTFERIVAPESLEHARAHFRQATQGFTVNFEHVAIRKDLERLFLGVALLPMVVDGEIVGVYGIAQDLTAVKRATRELESFFDLSAEMMGIAGTDGYFRRVNRAFEEALGYSRQDLLATPFIDFVQPADRDATSKQLELLNQKIPTVAFENRCRAKHGGERVLAWSIRKVPDENILYAVARDVTEQRQTELRIREQASLLEKARDAIIVSDLSHRIHYWNKSAERLYGWSARDAIGRNVYDLIYRDHRDVAQSAHSRLLADGEWTGELKQKNSEGRTIVGEVRWTLVKDDAGEPSAVLSITTDITDQKSVEAQFLRAQRVESLGTLAGGIAHDLNNILAPIMMAIGLLKASARDADDLKILNTIDVTAHRGADLVRQILLFARGEEGQQVPTPAGHLFREIANVIAGTFPKSIRCETRAAKDVWPIMGDPTQLHQVLLNLCVNARDAMPNGGTLTLMAENVVLDQNSAKANREGRIGPHVMITISDTGTGIPPAIRDKIFDPFFTTKEVGKGTGLGLSTVMTIVRTSRGFLRLHSEPGKGTTFWIYLPAATSAQLPKTMLNAAAAPRGNKEVVLLVDDEPSVRSITKQTLEAFGYGVLLASNGAEALAIYAQRQDEIAVVLTDMMMPVMDGPALIRSLLTLNPGAKIIAASGLQADGKTGKAGHPGIKYFIPKPYTAGTMLETLARALNDR